MKKNDNLKEERKGFWSIGYLEKQDYIKRMLEITHREIPQAEFDEHIEDVIAEQNEKYYDENFAECAPQDAVYMVIDTKETAFRTNNDILAGFHRIDNNDSWRGVYLEQDFGGLKIVLDNQRRRRALEDYTYIYHYDKIAEQCNQMFGTHKSIDQWANYIGGLFVKRQEAQEIYSFDSGSYFVSENKGINGEQLFFWMERNDKPGARQKGFGISLINLDKLLENWAEDRYEYKLDRLIFDDLEDMDEFIEDLAKTAMEENWGRMNAPTPEFSYGHPVLKSYIEYTLVRLRILDKNKQGYIIRDGGRVYYNTGLLNRFFRQILVCAELKIETHDVPGIGERQFEFFLNPYPMVAGHDSKFPVESGQLRDLPKIATYFEKKEDVLYDASLDIILNDEHIFEDGLKANRIPMFKDEYQRVKNNREELRNLCIKVQERIQTAIKRAQLLAERNHKLAVPQFWKEDAEVQFLLPIYMEENQYTGRPQCAIALRRAGNGSYYEGATILSLDMAYNNSRLIAKPDVTWLYRQDELEEQICKNTCSIAVKEVEQKYEDKIAQIFESIENSDSENPGEKPNENNIGKSEDLTNISVRPNGKGIKGSILGSSGTIARNLLKDMPSNYVDGKLKVRVIDINPQGTQYILEPIE